MKGKASYVYEFWRQIHFLRGGQKWESSYAQGSGAKKVEPGPVEKK